MFVPENGNFPPKEQQIFANQPVITHYCLKRHLKRLFHIFGKLFWHHKPVTRQPSVTFHQNKHMSSHTLVSCTPISITTIDRSSAKCHANLSSPIILSTIHKKKENNGQK
jgi:hypothetical protein